MKKTICIIAIITVAVCLIIFFVHVVNKSNNEEKANTNINREEVIRITEFNITGRTSLVTEGGIYIGNNIKELENNFYDIKITNTEEGVDVYLNKLWYETYGKDYIQDEYLAKICRELSTKFNILNGTEQFEYLLYKYIKDNYVAVRQNEIIQEIKVENLNLKLKLTKENIVKLIIRSSK